VYGATFTAISDTQAIRFGGFCSPGFSDETNQIALLTLHSDSNDNNDDNDGNDDNTDMTQQEDLPNEGRGQEEELSSVLHASWEVIETKNSPPAEYLARAYHTATLLKGRYLVIIGGMKSSKSLLDVAILDTKTWVWIHDILEISSRIPNQFPSKRYGHSVVLDECRNRFVLFGGGNGSDLLHSGTDNAEVWELSIGDTNSYWNDDDEECFESSPWLWEQITPGKIRTGVETETALETTGLGMFDNNEDGRRYQKEQTYQFSGETSNEKVAQRHTKFMSSVKKRQKPQQEKLAPCEESILGRCHINAKISTHTILLAFGSGDKSTTNRLIGFDLRSNVFIRPNVPTSEGNDNSNCYAPYLPAPRRAASSVYLPKSGHLFVHGGYSTQKRRILSDPCLLDIASSLDRNFKLLPERPQYPIISLEPKDAITNNAHTAITRKTNVFSCFSNLNLFTVLSKPERTVVSSTAA